MSPGGDPELQGGDRAHLLPGLPTEPFPASGDTVLVIDDEAA